MWELAPSGELYYEKFLTFAKTVLDKWKALDVSHSLSVVFFSRMYYYQPAKDHGMEPTSINRGSVNIDSDGRMYQDFYKMVLFNESRVDTPTDKLLWLLKREFLSFPRVLHWKVSLYKEKVAYGIPARASKGNFLEAINVTLNVLEKHYMDRDLSRTGNSIVMISPSSGVIEVEKFLSAITKQRMMDNGIGMDLLSLSQPPMHTVPLFIHKHRAKVRLALH